MQSLQIATISESVYVHWKQQRLLGKEWWFHWMNLYRFLFVFPLSLSPCHFLSFSSLPSISSFSFLRECYTHDFSFHIVIHLHFSSILSFFSFWEICICVCARAHILLRSSSSLHFPISDSYNDLKVSSASQLFHTLFFFVEPHC